MADTMSTLGALACAAILLVWADVERGSERTSRRWNVRGGDDPPSSEQGPPSFITSDGVAVPISQFMEVDRSGLLRNLADGDNTDLGDVPVDVTLDQLRIFGEVLRWSQDSVFDDSDAAAKLLAALRVADYFDHDDAIAALSELAIRSVETYQDTAMPGDQSPFFECMFPAHRARREYGESELGLMERICSHCDLSPDTFRKIFTLFAYRWCSDMNQSDHYLARLLNGQIPPPGDDRRDAPGMLGTPPFVGQVACSGSPSTTMSLHLTTGEADSWVPRALQLGDLYAMTALRSLDIVLFRDVPEFIANFVCPPALEFFRLESEDDPAEFDEMTSEDRAAATDHDLPALVANLASAAGTLLRVEMLSMASEGGRDANAPRHLVDAMVPLVNLTHWKVKWNWSVDTARHGDGHLLANIERLSGSLTRLEMLDVDFFDGAVSLDPSIALRTVRAVLANCAKLKTVAVGRVQFRNAWVGSRRFVYVPADLADLFSTFPVVKNVYSITRTPERPYPHMRSSMQNATVAIDDDE